MRSPSPGVPVVETQAARLQTRPSPGGVGRYHYVHVTPPRAKATEFDCALASPSGSLEEKDANTTVSPVEKTAAAVEETMCDDTVPDDVADVADDADDLAGPSNLFYQHNYTALTIAQTCVRELQAFDTDLQPQWTAEWGAEFISLHERLLAAVSENLYVFRLSQDPQWNADVFNSHCALSLKRLLTDLAALD